MSAFSLFICVHNSQVRFISLNRKMKSIPSKNVENLFNDLEVALIDIKAVLDPFGLLSLADFYSHLNKK